MKQTIAFSLDTETIRLLRQRALKGNFRNKSHLVEEAIKRLLEVEE